MRRRAARDGAQREAAGGIGGHLRDGAEIYRRSFAIIRAEADLAGLDAALERTVVRMIHACGMVDITGDIAASPGFAQAATDALIGGAPILCDTQMVAAGITRSRLPAENEVVCTIGEPDVPELAASLRCTRSAAAVAHWRERMDGSLCVIGNAPTALFALLAMIEQGAPRPAAVIGVPVGFVGAAESKLALSSHEPGLDHLVVHGRRGGSAIAAAAVNALACERE